MCVGPPVCTADSNMYGGHVIDHNINCFIERNKLIAVRIRKYKIDIHNTYLDIKYIHVLLLGILMVWLRSFAGG